MVKRAAAAFAVLIFISALWPSAGHAQKAEVKAYEAYEQIDEHNQLPLDPYPPFGLLTGYICYPNQFYGSRQFQVTPRRLRLLVAENEYLKIATCPDYGGRLYYMYDKVRKREVIHRIYTASKFYNAGMGLQYVDGGLELNIPNAHSQTNARPRECLSRRNADGSAVNRPDCLVLDTVARRPSRAHRESVSRRAGYARPCAGYPGVRTRF